MLPVSTEMPLSDIAGLYELRDELLSDDRLGIEEAILLMVSTATPVTPPDREGMLDNGGRPAAAMLCSRSGLSTPCGNINASPSSPGRESAPSS